jgi:hypothetical protein
MDLIDITEGAIHNTWKELVDRYDIFVFDSEESKIIDDYEYGEKYIVWNEKEGTISYEAKSKQQAS